MPVAQVTKSDISQLMKLPYLASIIFLILAIVISIGVPLLNENGASFSLYYKKFLIAAKDAVPLTLLAVGAAFVVSTGQVDLSTGGVAAISGVLWALASVFIASEMFVHAVICYVVIAAIPIAVGGVNSFLCVQRRAPSLVITWAVGGLLFVVAIVLATAVKNGAFGTDLTCKYGTNAAECAEVTGVQSGFDYSLSFWWGGGLTILVAILATYYAINRAMRLGKQCAAVGANYKSAGYLGLNVTVIETWSFMASALFCATAGILTAEFLGEAKIGSFVGKELTAIAIGVLGGTVLSGGYFSFVSMTIAAYAWSLILSSANGYRGPFNETMGSHLPSILFALIIVGFGTLLGRRLSGHTRPVLVSYKSS